jgi:hypothetical protein
LAGYQDSDSFDKGYILLFRQKKDKTVIELWKKRISDENWLKEELQIESIEDGEEFFGLMGIKPDQIIRS